MKELDIEIAGGVPYLAPLYNLPQEATAQQVESEIKYWFQKTLDTDGFSNLQFTVSVADNYTVIKLSTLDGTDLPEAALRYGEAIPWFLRIGAETWQTVVPQLKADGKWDPDPNNKVPWQFFLPHGLPMVNFYTIQFFHYPPMRLLKQRNYLKDPVPYRWGQLLQTAGATVADTDLYQRYIDAVPIAANDDQGAFMPVSAFASYQQQMLRLFLTMRQQFNPVTVPVLVFGIPAMAQFEHLFKANLDILVPQVANIINGTTTPCLGSTHPYHFYAQAQIDKGQNGHIGDGRMGRGCQLAQVLMQQDLIAAYWQVAMAKNPQASVGDTLFEATAWALGSAMTQTVCALTRHQGSLLYPNPETYDFEFNILYPEPAMSLCTGDGINPCV